MRYTFSDEKKATTTTTSRAKSQARLLNSASYRRAARTTLRHSYGMGMWRAVALLACLSATHAALFTEGGAVQNGKDNKANKYVEFAHDDKINKEDLLKYYGKEVEQYKDDDSYMEYLIEYMKSHPVPAQFPNFEQEAEQEHQDELNQWLEQLMNEQELLEPANAAVKDAEQKAPLAPVHHKQVAQKPAQEPFDLDDLLRGELMLENEIAKESELKKTQEKLSEQTPSAKANVESLESAMQTATGEPQVPQKKGQNEFVSFVEQEPQPAKQTISSHTPNFSCTPDIKYIDTPEFLISSFHIASVVSAPIHVFGLFCILFKTPTQMITVKRCLLILHGWIVATDYTCSVFTIPLILAPRPAVMMLGVLKDTSIPVDVILMIMIILIGYII